MAAPTILPLGTRSTDMVLRTLLPALNTQWSRILIEGDRIEVDWVPRGDGDTIEPADERTTYELVYESVKVAELVPDGRPFAYRLLRTFLWLEARQVFPSYIACSAGARKTLRKLVGFPPMVPFRTLLGAQFVDAKLGDHMAVVLGVPGIGYPLTSARLGVRLDLETEVHE